MGSQSVRLEPAVIDERLSELEGWERTDGQWIERVFRLNSFPAAIQWVNTIAEQAEVMNHHPRIVIDYKRVTVQLTTHDANGLTERDLFAARQFNARFETFG
ncbi:4a-hydroxytetrahydrobiopterin dehydratase [Paenibacillaceae bacterium]|nr:4a-hydroxytetrahydrobiopterin dehydratase [Paenibacillaceae bacterium]